MNKNKTLDRTAGEIRRLIPPPEVETAVAGRVWNRLEELAQRDDLAIDSVEGRSINSCEDFQALMPALLDGTLPGARRLLVEDHARHCIPCRKALRRLRSGESLGSDPMAAAMPRRSGWGRVALAAGVLLAAALGGLVLSRALYPTAQDDLVRVQAVDGHLFQVAGDRLEPLRVGDRLDGRQSMRTAGSSGAVVELADGSMIEVAERSTLSVVGRRSGYRIRVDQGSIIVQAAKQRRGTLDVVTDELFVSVKGTIFAVTHGTKGSRVSVIEGEVEAEKGRQERRLLPGDQWATRAQVGLASVEQQIGWSRDFEHYVALLQELRALRRDLGELLAQSEPRYSSRLLEQVPVATTVYVAMPNPTTTVAEAYRLIRDRMRSNALLAGWWQEFESSGMAPRVDRFISDVRELGDYLGEEAVVAVTRGSSGWPETPVVLSEVTNPMALRVALEEKIAGYAIESGVEAEQVPIRFVDDLAAATPGGGDEMLIHIDGDLMVASNSLDSLREVAAADAAFVGTAFHEQITTAYDEGAEFLAAVDLEALMARLIAEGNEGRDTLERTGILDARYLLVERHQDTERTHTSATISFAQERQGLVGWLAEPGPLGALEFFSPDATFVAAGVIEEPIQLFDEMLEIAMQDDPDVADGLADLEQELGLSVRDDLVATLGGEGAFGLDGPTLPTPSWKAVIEVYDDATLQTSLETLVTRLDEQDQVSAALDFSESGGRTYYRIAVSAEAAVEGISGGELHYGYAYGYLVAAPSRALVASAIETYESDASLTTAESFRSLLPQDRFVDFSAVVYNRLAEMAQGLLSQLPLDQITADQQQAFGALTEILETEVGPSLYCLYGEPNQLRITSNGPSFLPFAGLTEVFGLGSAMWGIDFEQIGRRAPAPSSEAMGAESGSQGPEA